MRELPHPVPRVPKISKMTGVPRAKETQDLLEWAVKAVAVLFSRVPEVDRIAKATLQNAPGRILGGVGGRTYSDDGTLPGPTPGAAARVDYERKNIADYHAGLSNLLSAVLLIADATGRFRVLDRETAKRHRLSEDGGDDCSQCDRWVSQTPSDRLRGGLCVTCYHEQRRAAASTN